MKRKVLAILVPAFLMAGAAHAAEMYNKNGNIESTDSSSHFRSDREPIRKVGNFFFQEQWIKSFIL